jgi:hypothetical protein
MIPPSTPHIARIASVSPTSVSPGEEVCAIRETTQVVRDAAGFVGE